MTVAVDSFSCVFKQFGYRFCVTNFKQTTVYKQKLLKNSKLLEVNENNRHESVFRGTKEQLGLVQRGEPASQFALLL